MLLPAAHSSLQVGQLAAVPRVSASIFSFARAEPVSRLSELVLLPLDDLVILARLLFNPVCLNLFLLNLSLLQSAHLRDLPWEAGKPEQPLMRLRDCLGSCDHVLDASLSVLLSRMNPFFEFFLLAACHKLLLRLFVSFFCPVHLDFLVELFILASSQFVQSCLSQTFVFVDLAHKGLAI